MATCLSRDPMLPGLKEAGDMPGDEAVKLLDSYRGIGPKIASCVALMSLDKLDAFPVDRWVRRALGHCDLSAMPARLAARVLSSHTMTEAQQYRVARWAKRHFGQYAGYANQYLFHWIEPHKEMVARSGACRICGTGPPDSTTHTASNPQTE